MDFLEDEVRQDLELHGRVLSMDCEDFGAHLVGFFKCADQWLDWRSSLQPHAPPHRRPKMPTGLDMSS